MRRKFLLILLVLGSFLVFPRRAQAARLFLDPATSTVSSGEQFNVQVKVDPAGSGVVAIDAVVSFDATKLEAVDVQEVTYFKDETVGTAEGFTYNIENEAGKVYIYSFANVPNFSVSTVGAIATIKFRAKATGTATATFVCQAGEKNDSSVWDKDGNDLLDCAAVGSGTYTIQEGSGGTTEEQPTPEPTSSVSTPTPTALPTTGIETPMSLTVLLGGILLGVGALGLIF